MAPDNRLQQAALRVADKLKRHVVRNIPQSNQGYTMAIDPQKNKQNAIDFYRTAYLGNPEKAVASYVGSQYIQNNPIVADGKQGFIECFEKMASE